MALFEALQKGRQCARFVGWPAMELQRAIDRSAFKWNKRHVMTRSLNMITGLRAALAAPASYYYVEGAGTS